MSVASSAAGANLQRFGEGEDQDGVLLKRSLWMADEQVSRHHAGSDQAAGHGAHRAADNCAGRCAGPYGSAVLDAVALEA